MADRCKNHPWGTCDGCGVDLGGVCCYSPHQFGEYDTLCHSCFTDMKAEAEKRTMIVGGSPISGKAKGPKNRGK